MCGFYFFFQFPFGAFMMVSVDLSRPQKRFEHPDLPSAAPEVETGHASPDYLEQNQTQIW